MSRKGALLILNPNDLLARTSTAEDVGQSRRRRLPRAADADSARRGARAVVARGFGDCCVRHAAPTAKGRSTKQVIG